MNVSFRDRECFLGSWVCIAKGLEIGLEVWFCMRMRILEQESYSLSYISGIVVNSWKQAKGWHRELKSVNSGMWLSYESYQRLLASLQYLGDVSSQPMADTSNVKSHYSSSSQVLRCDLVSKPPLQPSLGIIQALNLRLDIQHQHDLQFSSPLWFMARFL